MSIFLIFCKYVKLVKIKGKSVKTYLLAVCLIGLQGSGFAKPTKILHGRVQDSETGIDLPLANIQIEGTFRGTISNDAGRYRLEIPQLPATLRVRYIGYQSQPVLIAESSPDSLDILLKPTVIPFREIIVTGEDPAVAILRKVIESKAAWRDRLRTFKAETYSRFNLENDSGIVSIAESVSELYWDRAKGMREVIKFQQETSNLTKTKKWHRPVVKKGKIPVRTCLPKFGSIGWTRCIWELI